MVIPTELPVPDDDPSRYRDLFLAVPLGQALVDGASRIVAANPAADRMFGGPGSRLAGRRLTEIVDAASEPAVTRAFANAQGGTTATVTVTGRNLGGQVFPVELAVVRVRAGPSGLFGIMARDLRPSTGGVAPTGAATQYTLAELLMANRLRELV